MVQAGGPLCSPALPCDGPCGALAGVPNALFFDGVLPLGACSPIFALALPPHLRLGDAAAGGIVAFCYVRTATDGAHVDIPAWVVRDPAVLDRLHGILLCQCLLGEGYPRALSLAHQFAVLTNADRAAYFGLLARHGLAGAPSPKAWSKARQGESV